MALALAVAGCVAAPETADTFDPAFLVSGHAMTREQCRHADTSVWVVVDGQGECVRYFHAGLRDANPLVHVWFHGDQIHLVNGSPQPISYTNNSPEKLSEIARKEFRARGIAYIRFSRPGTFGSSGDHRHRRRPREIAVIAAAVDALKAKYRIERFALSGQSGGGHVVASLLARRNDVVCAVSTSGVVSVRERVRIKGWARDITGYDDYIDPIDLVGAIPKDGRRIFIVGDPADALVPFATQASYVAALKAAGHAAWLIRARAKDKQRHTLSSVGHEIVRRCVDGWPAERIVEEATSPGMGG